MFSGLKESDQIKTLKIIPHMGNHTHTWLCNNECKCSSGSFEYAKVMNGDEWRLIGMSYSAFSIYITNKNAFLVKLLQK
jgi:hypothetical protein